MINLNNHTTAAAAFENRSAMTRQIIISDDESCFFESLLCCIGHIYPHHTHNVASLRTTTKCLSGPLPFEKIILLAKWVCVNILVIIHDKTFSSGSSFFAFVHDVVANGPEQLCRASSRFHNRSVLCRQFQWAGFAGRDSTVTLTIPPRMRVNCYTMYSNEVMCTSTRAICYLAMPRAISSGATG
jgi:hypothetical protein